MLGQVGEMEAERQVHLRQLEDQLAARRVQVI